MENTIKKPYTKPEIQVIVINNESPLLVASNGTPTEGKKMPIG